MPYSRTLGVIPAGLAITLVQGLQSLFGASSYDATHQRILQWVQMIANDPTGAVGPITPGNNFTDTAADALLGLRCWAGDQSVLAIYRQKSGDPAPNGCGCEVSHGCRADAQEALTRVEAFLHQAVPPVSSAPIPSGNVSVPTGTVYTTLPGGINVGLPVPGETLLTSSIAGVPMWAWAAGLALVAFAGGSRRGA